MPLKLEKKTKETWQILQFIFYSLGDKQRFTHDAAIISSAL